jgi:serine/threonine-protein kinase
MAAPDLGECAGFVWDLQRSGLVDRSRLEDLVSQFLGDAPGAKPDLLAQHLIQSGDLSNFQAERLLSGHCQDLVLNEYVLIDAIGQGSMGTVYKAYNKGDSQLYALKLLPRRSMWNVRIARRIVRAFEDVHPSIVAFKDVGTAGASHYLTWELAEGETLEARVKRMERLPPGVAALYGLQVALGLAVLHRQNVVHGLIKPSNILVSPENHARILDSGIGALIADTSEESMVDTMSTANTVTTGLDCRSPEAILEPTLRTPAGDQYSLGCVLYFCLTGQFPFQDMSAVQKMMAHQAMEPPPVRQLAPNVPQALADVIDRLMRKKPEDRYSGPDEIVDALRPLAVKANIAGKLTGSKSEPPAPPRKAAAAQRRSPGPARKAAAPAAAPVYEDAEPVPQAEAAYAQAAVEPVAEAAWEQPQEAEAAWANPEEYAEAASEPEAFERPVPLPRPGKKSAKKSAKKSGARSAARSAGRKPSMAALAGAGLLGYALGAALVGGAIWWMYSQGYLAQ